MPRHYVARFLTIAILAATIVAPPFAGALPRPDQATQLSATQQEIALLTVPATNPSTVSTPVLTNGRQYRFEISGTWKWAADTCTYAEMAFTTSNCWTTRSKTGLGLVIDGVKQADTAVQYRSDHTYFMSWAGQGVAVRLYVFDTNYDDNSGAITVRVFQTSRVTYQLKLTQPIGVSDVFIPTTTVDARSVCIAPEISCPVTQTVTVVVGPVVVPSIPLPGPFLTIYVKHNDQDEFVITTDPPLLPPLVFLDVYKYAFGQTLIETATVAAGGPIPEQRTCDPPCPIFESPTQFTIGQQRIQPCFENRCLSSGSSLNVILTWTADRSHLYLLNAQDPLATGQTALWLPWNPRDDRETEWFQANMSALSATIDVAIMVPPPPSDPGGPPRRLFGTSASAAGLGQFIEAAFETKVSGQ